MNMNNPVAVTADFRLPKAVTIEAGKTYDIPVKMLADGHRGDLAPGFLDRSGRVQADGELYPLRQGRRKGNRT